LRGEKVADSYDDLWDREIGNIIYTEDGATVADYVWTGTELGGATATSGGTPTVGDSNVVDEWVDIGLANTSDDLNHLYGLSEVLTATAIPEPTSLVLAAVAGTLGLVGHRVRSKRKRRQSS